MNKLSILFNMGFYKSTNLGHIYINKNDDNILAMSIKDIKNMTGPEFKKFHNNAIGWLSK